MAYENCFLLLSIVITSFCYLLRVDHSVKQKLRHSDTKTAVHSFQVVLDAPEDSWSLESLLAKTLTEA